MGGYKDPTSNSATIGDAARPLATKLAMMMALAPIALSFAAPSSDDLPTVWPAPSSSRSGTGVRTVAPSKAFFRLATGSSPLLEAAFERYVGLTFPHAVDSAVPLLSSSAPACEAQSASAASAAVTYMQIDVADLAEDHPRLETDESYTLRISDDDAQPFARGSAQTVYGALRLLESFSQLVAYDFDCGRYEVVGTPWRVDDAPRFAHRGLMVDTARHYEPLAAVRAIVDSLSYAKLNVLHWHMVDIQSFPFESKSSPRLWEGAYAPSQRYTQADVAAVVEHARLRGVRVIVEFDMPGHAGSW